MFNPNGWLGSLKRSALSYEQAAGLGRREKAPERPELDRNRLEEDQLEQAPRNLLSGCSEEKTISA